MKRPVNGVTTVYIAGVYEWQNGATTLYYEGNAMRRARYASDNGVFYLLQDHLKSSSSAFVTQGGTVNSRNYYFPFGGNRGGAAFSQLTTKRFTGQYHEKALPGGEGLSYYGARWYDAQVGRFLTPDTIVPGPANPQAFNRYSYVKNQPLNRIDPTGHYDIVPGDDPWWRRTNEQHGKAALPVPSWRIASDYSEWYSLSSPYSGCLKCHAAKNSGKSALNNDELWSVTSAMQDAQRQGIEMLVRSFDPIDYAFTTYNCWQNSRCDLNELGFTIIPLLSGNLYRNVDDWMSFFPKRAIDHKTTGILLVGDQAFEITSGMGWPTSAMPTASPGLNGVVKTHVEAHAATFMRIMNVNQATLVMNNTPCGTKWGCDAMLPLMLPEGAKLRIIGPNNFDKLYTGLPD